MLRGTITAMALTASGVLSAGCGSDPPHLVTKHEAAAFAHAVNLRAGDVPGLTRTVPALPAPSEPFGSCPHGAPIGSEIVALNSPGFRRAKAERGESVSSIPVETDHSTVYVMRSPAVVSRLVAVARTAKARDCTQRKLAKGESLKQGHERFESQIKVSSLAFLLPGIAGYGIRVGGTLAAALFHTGRRAPFYEDTFGFAVGTAEILLSVDSLPQPPSPADERRLLMLLYNRAKAHKLS